MSSFEVVELENDLNDGDFGIGMVSAALQLASAGVSFAGTAFNRST